MGGTDSNNEPEDIQTTNEFEIQVEILQDDNSNGKVSSKELPNSQHADIQGFADFEESNVPSAEDEEPTDLINA
ncbi:hypothetical protein K3495_g8795 [Podosphaera aphanis]|nr:hypothetical protein K3495_g8795 [Podosphaera aphanis]